MVTFTKNESGIWVEKGDLPKGCRSVHVQWLSDGRWIPKTGTTVPLSPKVVRACIEEGPNAYESYRMIPVKGDSE